MKRLLFVVVIAAGFLAGCSEDESNNIGGGQLPAKYIFVDDSTFSPIEVNLVNGGAVQFVNRTAVAHTLMSNDSNTFEIVLPPLMSVYFRPDTVISSAISLPYHCVEHPIKQGLITIQP
ncbi:MAG: hypothetical protein EOO01_23180 [Chitinophagaceae bacterium]|nr:MAG: hypothetical protein EOO01_23180 [Chitinophagaceae bacterium]